MGVAIIEILEIGAKINLQEQPFQVLVLLLGRPGEVVTRDELSRQLWPVNTFCRFRARSQQSHQQTPRSSEGRRRETKFY